MLAFLGYYPGAVDGVWGEKSRKATVDFQGEYCEAVDGIWGQETQKRILEAVAAWQENQSDDWWQEIRFFDREEFRCQCGGAYCGGYPARMKRDAVMVADRAREYFGRAGYVVSGLRCSRHNAAVGGVENSQHMAGEAVDLRIEGVGSAELLAYLQKQPEVRYAYAINGTNVHFDIPRKAG